MKIANVFTPTSQLNQKMLTRYYKIFVSLFSMGDFYDLKILTIKQYDIKFPLTSYIEHSNKAHTKVLKTNSKVNGY